MSKLKYVGLSIAYALFVLAVGLVCYKQGRQDGYDATEAFYARADAMWKKSRTDEGKRELANQLLRDYNASQD